MAEALGVAASIIAVIQLTTTAIGFLQDIKGAPKEHQRVKSELGSAVRLLLKLNEVVQSDNPDSPTLSSVRELNAPEGSLSQYKQALESLVEKVNPTLRSPRLTWPFKKDEVLHILKAVERQKTYFALALQRDQLDLSLRQVDLTRQHMGLSQSLQEDVKIMRKMLDDQETLALEKLHVEALNWLSPSVGAQKHADVSCQRQKGTGSWLLHHEKYLEWQDGVMAADSGKKFVWGRGVPGAGKTVIASLVIDFLTMVKSQPNVAIAYFYCNYGSRTEQTAANIISCLVRQLLHRNDLLSPLMDMYASMRKTAMRPNLCEIVGLFGEAAKGYDAVYIVMDALDELDTDERDSLLRELLSSARKTPCRLFFTSRGHLEDLNDAFEHYPQIKMDAAETDVRSYLESKIHARKKSSQVMNQQLKEEVINKILQESRGVFLLPALQIESVLEHKSTRDMRDALKRLPSTLPDAFDSVMDRIFDQAAPSKTLAMKVLYWLTHALRVLEVDELMHALAVRPGDLIFDEEGLYSIEVVVDVCQGLVLVDRDAGTVRLMHPTVQEYLCTRDWRSGLTTAVHTCLTYLQFEPFQRGPLEPEWRLEQRLAEYPFYDYATSCWAKHLMKLKDLTGTELADVNTTLLLDFLTRENYLASSLQATSRLMHPEFRGRGRLIASRATHVAAEHGLAETLKLLLDAKKMQVDEIDSNMQTPLHLAAVSGRKTAVALLLERGANVNAPADPWGTTTLMMAIRAKHEAIAQMLLEAGADVGIANLGGETPLRLAANLGWVEIVNALIQRGADAAADSKSALHRAAEHGRVDLVKSLLAQGVDPNFVSHGRHSPLSSAIEHAHHEVVRMLCEAGAKLNTTADDDGDRALWPAAMRNENFDHVSYIFEDDCEVNHTLHDQCSVLHRAAQYSGVETVKYLVEHGANLEARDGEGATVLHHAASNHRYGVSVLKYLLTVFPWDVDDAKSIADSMLDLMARRTSDVEILKALLDRGAEIYAQKRVNGKRTILEAAASRGHNEVVCFLLDSGYTPRVGDWVDTKALFRAAWVCNVETVEALLTAIGYTPRDEEGRTLLHDAMRNESAEMIDLALRHGCEINAVDKSGKNALFESIEYGWTTHSRMLIDRGARIQLVDDIDGTEVVRLVGRAFRHGLLEGIRNASIDSRAKDARGVNGRTALHGAAANDLGSRYGPRAGYGCEHGILAHYLLGVGADVTARDKDGMTPLHLCVDVSVGRILLEAGADPRARTNKGHSVLQHILLNVKVKRGASDMVEPLVEHGADVNETNEKGVTILHMAARYCAPSTVEYLVSRGADVNSVTKSGRTVLHAAVCNRIHFTGILPLMMAEGLNLDSLDAGGMSALSFAINQRCLPFIVEALVEAGADVRIPLTSGAQVLHQAMSRYESDLIKYLIDHGTDVRAKTAKSVSVLDTAVARGKDDAVRLLLAAGADTRSVDNGGRGCAHRASRLGYTNILEDLSRSEAWPEVRWMPDNAGMTPLMYALVHGHGGAAKYLLSQPGLDVNHTSAVEGRTALHYAVMGSQVSLVEDLVNRGFPTDRIDCEGNTPAHLVPVLARNSKRSRESWGGERESMEDEDKPNEFEKASTDFKEEPSKFGRECREFEDKDSSVSTVEPLSDKELSDKRHVEEDQSDLEWSDEESRDLMRWHVDKVTLKQLSLRRLELKKIKMLTILHAVAPISDAQKNRDGKTVRDLAQDSDMKDLLAWLTDPTSPTVTEKHLEDDYSARVAAAKRAATTERLVEAKARMREAAADDSLGPAAKAFCLAVWSAMVREGRREDFV